MVHSRLAYLNILTRGFFRVKIFFATQTANEEVFPHWEFPFTVKYLDSFDFL